MAAVGSASRCFPLIGVIVGGLSGAVFLGLAETGLSPLVLSFLAIAVQVLVTGALHEDAIGDVADGFGGGHDKVRKLEIMRDSRVGTYAVVALILTIGLKVSALASLEVPSTAFLALVASGAASRAFISLAMYLMPPARQDGLGASAGKPPLTAALMALALGLLVPIILFEPFFGSAALLAGMGAALVTGFIAIRQIGGQTGDVLGTIQQVSEIAFLLTLSAMIA